MIQSTPWHRVMRSCFFAAAIISCGSALAERADRNKPVDIDADRVTVDDKNKVHTFEGRVKLVQGTLVIFADKIVVSQDAEGFQKGVATGGPGGLARFKQKREGKDEMIEGEAERIVYDSQTEVAKLFQRAHVKSGNDEVRGQYIEYNGYTENYVVTNGPNSTTAPSGGRVHVTIQPKKNNSDGSTPDSQASPESRTAPPAPSPDAGPGRM